MRKKWVRPPGLRESANQDLFPSLEEYQLNRMPKRFHTLKNPCEVGKEHALPDIDSKRDILNLPSLLMTELNKGRQNGGRQIINTEIPDIFKALERMRLP